MIDSEIEITPEMIEAGLSSFYDYDSRFEVKVLVSTWTEYSEQSSYQYTRA